MCAAPDQWTEVPVLVKIYKLLINELSNQIEAALAKQEEEAEDEEEDDEDEVCVCVCVCVQVYACTFDVFGLCVNEHMHVCAPSVLHPTRTW